MNTKIIVALVIGIALIGLTGAASSMSYDAYGRPMISSHTEIQGTDFTSESYTRVSGISIQERYDSTFIAPLIGPTFPPADLCVVQRELEGSNYRSTSAVRSSPSRNTVSVGVSNPREVSGTIDWFSCVEWGMGLPAQSIALPQDSDNTAGVSWCGTHSAGSAYQAYYSDSTSIWWP